MCLNYIFLKSYDIYRDSVIVFYDINLIVLCNYDIMKYGYDVFMM